MRSNTFEISEWSTSDTAMPSHLVIEWTTVRTGSERKGAQQVGASDVTDATNEKNVGSYLHAKLEIFRR